VGEEPAEQAYAAALNTFRAREHGQAVLDFLDFIAKYPKHALAPNAQYWIGEAYFVQRDYRQAVLEFQRVIEMAPRTPKAADALLRLGMCHANLREASPAAEAWQRLVRDYPRSDAAGKARSFLRAGVSPRQP
jgi:tol-pal system protein YbgF